MSSPTARRLGKELSEIQTAGVPQGIKLLTADDLISWTFSIEVFGESLYKGEVFGLLFTFSSQYPFEAPRVVFIVKDAYKAPEHPHVYSNGHICASILDHDWSPTLSVLSVCITLQSMLASCKKKERPEDNDTYVKDAPLSPKTI